MRYTDPRTGETRDIAVLKPALLAVLGVLGLLIVCGVVIGGCKSLDSTDAGQVAVVLNGGPFDSKDQRETVPPSSGYKIPGLASTWHKYYSDTQQRYFRISAAGGDDPATTSVTVPTQDGYQVSIEALANFHTVFTGLDDDPALREFDLKFGQRGFGPDDKRIHEDGGWEEFLRAQIGPVVVSTFREAIGSTECEELISSCALVQQTATNPDAPVQVDEEASEQLSQVETAVQTELARRVDVALGGEYLTGWQVNIEKVSLPSDVQAKINAAQAEYAEIAKAKASAQAAEFEARKTRILAEQYADNPEYAQIKSVESCAVSQSCQIILGAQGLGLNVGK